MKARQLIDGASGAFDPEQMKVIGRAFDEAWSRIEAGVSPRKPEVEYTRVELAKAVLSAAGEGVTTAEALVEVALTRAHLMPKT
jgi:hypothetical protein